MALNGSCSESSSLPELSLEDTSAVVLIDEGEEVEELREEDQEEVMQYITYNTVSESLEYDTAEMVDISSAGLLVGCGVAFFAFLVRLGIKSVLSTFRAFTGAGKEEL